ncbi:MAG: alpha/beta fold hydrolase, partial [Verrucomicrobiota bacterium]|nr:alpha/beta fold hydrolase [Verrucomicrobiota bacterium]
TEVGLSKVWNELLGLDGIPRSADFFELGGDSLRAVTLFLKIQQRFGKDLPLATLTHASTIAGLAKLIDGEGDAPDLSGYRSLQMIQQGDASVAPLFLIHGGQGNVLVFNGFAKSLDPRQPVYAFQWPGWDGFAGSSDVDELADDYCEELGRFLPEGPVRLGGYCIGGLVAVAMARRLGTAGRKVLGPLVVWDAPNLKSSRYRKEEPWDSASVIADFNGMKEQLKAIRIPTTFDDANVPNSDFTPPAGRGAMIRKVPGLITLLRVGKALRHNRRQAPRRRKTADYLKNGEALPMGLRPEYCLDCMVKAAKHHRSSGHAGDMLYFRSDCVVSRYFGLNGWWNDPFLGFAELCEGNFEAHAIGGGHTDVLDIPEMEAIVREKFQGLEP